MYITSIWNTTKYIAYTFCNLLRCTACNDCYNFTFRTEMKRCINHNYSVYNTIVNQSMPYLQFSLQCNVRNHKTIVILPFPVLQKRSPANVHSTQIAFISGFLHSIRTRMSILDTHATNVNFNSSVYRLYLEYKWRNILRHCGFNQNSLRTHSYLFTGRCYGAFAPFCSS